MKLLKQYNIPFVGLKLGKHEFKYDIEKTFFDCFDYEEFNDIAIKGILHFEKKTTLLELHFQVEGDINLNCDISNEPFNQPISGVFDLVVKFGQQYNDDHESILIIPHNEYQINVAQYFYELIILSIPLKRVHPGIKDGSLKSEALKKLEELSPKHQDDKNNSSEIDPRWSQLKNLLNNG